MSDTILITAKDVADMMSIHVKTFYSFMKKPEGAEFPRPIILGKRSHRWNKAEVEDWIRKMAK